MNLTSVRGLADPSDRAVHTHHPNPGQKPGNIVAIWLIEETPEGLIAAEYVLESRSGAVVSRAMEDCMQLILNWVWYILI